MGFLAPLFLIGLAAIAVPVLIHLTHRQRREPIAFPSLMFLRRIEFRTTKRQRIRNWLLFLLRALGVILLALAFSRPFLADASASAATDAGGRDVVVLLDGSLSMGLGGRWERARREANAVIDGLGPNDRATVVRFASRAEALSEPTADKGALKAAVAAARPGHDAGRYAPGIALARGILARGERPRKEVVLVGDLQRTGWAPDADVALPAGTVFRVADVGAGDSTNVAVTGLDLQRGAGAGERVELTAVARLANLGGEARTVPVALSLDGRELVRRDAALPANGVAAVSLGPVALPAGVVRGTVSIGSGAAGDDVRHFTVDRGRTLRVLLVQDATANPARALYLQRALALRGEPPFELELRRGADLSAADLAGRAVVIWDDAPAPRGGALRLLGEWVSGGGGLLVTFGDRTRPADWRADAAALLAALPGETLDRIADRGGRLGALDRTHTMLEPFAEAGSGNFSAPRFFRYRSLEPAQGAAIVARFDDGRVALAERRVGRGRTLAWASTFDNVWNDLPLHAVWVPLVRQMVQHAAAWRDEPGWRTVGEAIDASGYAQGARADATAEYVAVAPSGAQSRLTGAAPTLELSEPGIWEIRRFGEGSAPARLVAVNVDPRESDLARIPEAELVAAVTPRGEAAAAAGDVVALTATEREARQSIWWFLLLGAALLLAAETLLSNRLTRARR